MRLTVLVLALATCLAASACAAGTPPTSGPVVGSPPAQSPDGAQPPTSAPSPGASLDPALSDAGVVGMAVLPDDTRGGRTGVHVIIGERAAGSDCATTFDGTEFLAVAWIDDAADGQLSRLSVTVPAEDVPPAGGVSTDIDGRVSFDFVSESGFGTLYSGDSSADNDGSSTIDIARAGSALVFSFTGTTWDEVEFSGQLLCAVE